MIQSTKPELDYSMNGLFAGPAEPDPGQVTITN